MNRGLARYRWLLLPALATCLGVSPAAGQEPSVAKRIDFASDVLPILSKHCLACHGEKKQESGLRLDRRDSLLKGGERGEPAVVPGKGRHSLLIRAVSGGEADLRMPPEGETLAKEDVDRLEAWIDQGFQWPAENAAESAPTHWSLRPRAHVAVPGHQPQPGWASNPIDCFLAAKLRDAGLAPSPPAPRRRLLRRLHLVVLGLPPSPDAVEAFVADTSPDAFARAVDRALASPDHGPRWARHWLDVVRFAESNGYETNRERPTAWRYRDYVVDSLNADKPYDRFVREQLAGDALGADAATGFLVAGPYDIVRSPDINLTLMQRQDELADIVNATGTTFLGLTVGCARCHQHKFDPISQRDYYALQAVLAGVNHGERPITAPPGDVATRQQEAARLADELARARESLTTWQPRAFPGRTVLLDDEPVVAAASGDANTPRLEALLPRTGVGMNPAGGERGHRDDPGAPGRTPNLSRGSYSYWQAGGEADVAAYRPRVAGRFRVWISWGCGQPSHAAGAEYWLDVDGDPATRADQRLLARVDQRRFAGGSRTARSGEDPSPEPPGTESANTEQARSLWSGWFDAGECELNNASCLLLRCGKTAGVVTADAVVWQQEAESSPAPWLRPAVSPRQNVERFAPIAARRVRLVIAASSQSEPCLDEVEIHSAPTPDRPARNLALASSGAKVTASGVFQDGAHPLHQLAHVNDGQYGNSRSWIAKETTGWVEFELPESTMIDRVTWGRDRRGEFSDRVAAQYRVEVADETGTWTLVARSDDRVVGAIPGDAEFGLLQARLDASSLDTARALFARVGAVESRLAALRAPAEVAYAGVFRQPETTHRLYRGDPLAPREPVGPDTIAALGTLSLADDAPEAARRAALADWITSRDNPLTARVMANRVWHYHFGTGLVPTPNDFGANGVGPTHPELLDYLASQLVDHDWSVKQLHRQILGSSAFQQSSQPNDAGRLVDAQCQLLWRFPPRRLEAESLRDCVLAVSGVLDRRLGGEGFSLFDVQLENVRHYFPKEDMGPAEFRRMVYATKFRAQQDAVFGAFDCPDGSQAMPRRPVSTTPLQSLNLMNSHFILDQAQRLAARCRSRLPGGLASDPRREASSPSPETARSDPVSPDLQLQTLFLHAYGREPDESELRDALDFVAHTSLADLCRAVLNSNEFLFIP